MMKVGYTVILILLAVLTLISLVLSVTAVAGVLWLRQIALVSVAGARAVIPDIGDATISYTLEVEQEIPVAASVPINEEVVVPIHTTIPISTLVSIPIDAGVLGTFDIDVPVRAVVPVDLEFAVPIDQTVDIATTVQLDVDVPIEIPLADTPLVGYLEELDVAMETLEKELADPLGNRGIQVRTTEQP
jgi:hypothetical protein